MGLIKEPLDVDFFVEPKLLSDKERKMISEFIKVSNKQNLKKAERKKDNLSHNKINTGTGRNVLIA